MAKTINKRKFIYKEPRIPKKQRTTVNTALTCKKKPAVSDHALVRYCENVFKMDFEPLRDKILTPKNVKLINNGAASIKVDGGKFTIANKCITTFIPD
tara:strand:- start:6562 stop:6855 length:294 start_codon:yes stop_codon:yes gene_type:complete